MMKTTIMRSGLILVFALLASVVFMAATDQPVTSTPAKWEPATIMGVKAYPLAAEGDAAAARYEITVRAGNTEYVLLFVPPDGADTVQYHVGMDGLVLVRADTMLYNDILGNTRELPIISRRTNGTKGCGD